MIHLFLPHGSSHCGFALLSLLLLSAVGCYCSCLMCVCMYFYRMSSFCLFFLCVKVFLDFCVHGFLRCAGGLAYSWPIRARAYSCVLAYKRSNALWRSLRLKAVLTVASAASCPVIASRYSLFLLSRSCPYNVTANRLCDFDVFCVILPPAFPVYLLSRQ